MSIEKVTHRRIAEIVNGYPTLKGLSGIKLTYAITRNIKRLKQEIENLNESKYDSEEIANYTKEYKELVNAEVKRDATGAVINVSASEVALENPARFNEKLIELNKKYREELDKLKEENIKFEKFYNEAIEIDFFTFKSSELPNNITVEQRELLTEMEDVNE